MVVQCGTATVDNEKKVRFSLIPGIDLTPTSQIHRAYRLVGAVSFIDDHARLRGVV